MDDIYKILIAAAVGFALNPFTEIIKSSIATRDTKKKLISKLNASKMIVTDAIRTLHKTCTEREAYVNQRWLKQSVFNLPFIKTPNLQDDFDKCYLVLSKNQRGIIEIVIFGLAHVKKLESKVERLDESLKDGFTENAYTIEDEVKKAHDRCYKRILACEKAMLYTLIAIRNNLELAINDKPQNNTDVENLASAGEELGIDFNLSWWSHLLPRQNVSSIEIEDGDQHLR